MDRPLPKWEMWKHIPKLAANEAVALTLNIDPKKVYKWSKDKWVYNRIKLHGCVEVKEFADRLFLFERRFGAYGTVSLSELVDWSRSVDWDIPSELVNAVPTPRPALEVPTVSAANKAPSQELEQEDALADTERDKLLKHIGCLALLLAEKSNRYKRGEKPNANAMAESIQALIAEMPDVVTYGTGTASIRDSISKGIAALTKLK